MSRNGNGVYSLPGTYQAVSGETIEAQQHNDPLEDLQSDANTARPIVAGGTGATTAADARTSLDVPQTSDLINSIVQKQGRLTPHEGLLISYATASTVSVTADALVLFDSSGNAKRFTTWTNTVDITVAGAGGLDGGSEASSTWYYIWAIGKTDGTKSVIFSTSTTAPTLPGGYTYKGIIGAVRNEGSSNFVAFNQLDREVSATVTPVLSNGASTTYAAVSLGSTVPTAIATQVILKALVNTSSGGPNSVVGIIASAGSGTTDSFGNVEVQANVDATGNTQTVSSLIDQTNGQIKYYVAGTNARLSLWSIGWRY